MTESNDFLELTSTENQVVVVRKSAIGAIEVVPASARVEGHIKLYIEGFKFLVQIEKDDLMRELAGKKV